MPEHNNHYQALGLPPQATAEEIKAAYRRLANRWHPDKHGGTSSIAEEQFKRVTLTYKVLSNEGQRRKYDLELLTANIAASPTAEFATTTSAHKHKP